MISMFVCLFVSTITQKITNRYAKIIVKSCAAAAQAHCYWPWSIGNQRDSHAQRLNQFKASPKPWGIATVVARGPSIVIRVVYSATYRCSKIMELRGQKLPASSTNKRIGERCVCGFRKFRSVVSSQYFLSAGRRARAATIVDRRSSPPHNVKISPSRK